MESIQFQFDGTYPPKAIIYRYCPKDPGNHWRVGGEICPVCRSRIVVVRYEPTEEQE